MEEIWVESTIVVTNLKIHCEANHARRRLWVFLNKKTHKDPRNHGLVAGRPAVSLFIFVEQVHKNSRLQIGRFKYEGKIFSFSFCASLSDATFAERRSYLQREERIGGKWHLQIIVCCNVGFSYLVMKVPPMSPAGCAINII